MLLRSVLYSLLFAQCCTRAASVASFDAQPAENIFDQIRYINVFIGQSIGGNDSHADLGTVGK